MDKKKNWFPEKIKLTNLQPNKKKGDKVQINTIRNEKGEVTAYTTEIQRKKKATTSNYIYANKMDNL